MYKFFKCKNNRVLRYLGYIDKKICNKKTFVEVCGLEFVCFLLFIYSFNFV